MSYYRRNLDRLGTAFPPTVKTLSRAAPVGGINSMNALMGMPEEDCIYTFNLMPTTYGLRLRAGYLEWANGCGTEDVRTILNYESKTAGGSTDRLWAVTSEGIWNVTLFGETSPVQDVVFTGGAAAPAGYGVKTEFTSDAGTHYMFYADGINGLHQFEDGTGWTIPVSGVNAGEWSYDPGGGVIGFPVDDVAFVMVHKLRIWVILEDDDDAWYLPVSSIAGELQKFVFGSKLVHGGRLMGLWNWTLDGGDGIDDYLVAVSRAGDVVIYSGADPAVVDPTAGQPWAQRGSWFIGETPNCRRFVQEYGSEMYILTSFGITSLRDLLQGSVANELRTSPSAKVARLLRADITSGIDSPNWAINVHPGDSFIQIVTPEPTNTPFTQYNQDLTTKAWGLWEGVPMISAETWSSNYYIGGKAGVVWIYDGNRDGHLLNDPDSGESVQFRTLTSFVAPGGQHATFKRAGIVRTIGLTAGTVSFSVEIVYDYEVATVLQAPTPVTPDFPNVWDSAVWDLDVWDFGVGSESLPVGVLGLGRVMAVAMRGSAASRITIVGWDISYTEGGFL